MAPFTLMRELVSFRSSSRKGEKSRSSRHWDRASMATASTYIGTPEERSRVNSRDKRTSSPPVIKGSRHFSHQRQSSQPWNSKTELLPLCPCCMQVMLCPTCHSLPITNNKAFHKHYTAPPDSTSSHHEDVFAGYDYQIGQTDKLRRRRGVIEPLALTTVPMSTWSTDSRDDVPSLHDVSTGGDRFDDTRSKSKAKKSRLRQSVGSLILSPRLKKSFTNLRDFRRG